MTSIEVMNIIRYVELTRDDMRDHARTLIDNEKFEQAHICYSLALSLDGFIGTLRNMSTTQ